MMWFTIIILVTFWVIAMAGSYTLGGFVHVLLVLAAIVFIVKFVTGRKPDL
jgi:hypothetical protein